MNIKKTSTAFGIANILLLISMFWHPEIKVAKIIFVLMYAIMIGLFIFDAVKRNK